MVIRNHGYLKSRTGARFLTVDRERISGITRVGFGRTEVSIPFLGRIFRALSHRDGPVGPSLQGMPEKCDFHVFVFV